MFVSPDVSVKEVPTPPNLWCSSGHTAVTEWAREGAGTKIGPTRFFQISSAKHAINGVYCEPCLTIANALARQNKMETK